MTITLKDILLFALFLALVVLSHVLDRMPLPCEPLLASLMVLGRHAWMLAFSVSSWFDAPRISRYYPRFHRGLAGTMFLLTLGMIGLDLHAVWTQAPAPTVTTLLR